MPQITEFLLTHNITYELLTLLVFIAIITTLSNAFRYIFGLKSLGLYPSIMIALAYYLTGAKFGLIITVVIVAITFGTHELFKKVRMHYLSRIAINYIFITISLIVLMLLLDATNWEPIQTAINKINPISVIIIASLSDHIIKLYVKKNIMTTIRALIETIIVALLGWAFISIDSIKDFFVNNILILVILIPINIYIGKTSVLRITEYFRFKKIIENASGNTQRK